MQAGDPGCVYNQHVWDEVVRNAEKQNELVILGQHDPVESLLAGARGGAVTTRVDRLVRGSVLQIADVFDPTRQV